MSGKYGQYKYRMLAELGDHEPEEIRADWLLSANHAIIEDRHIESSWNQIKSILESDQSTLEIHLRCDPPFAL